VPRERKAEKVITFYVKMTRVVEWNAYQIEDSVIEELINRHMGILRDSDETIDELMERAEAKGGQIGSRARWEAVLAGMVGLSESWDGATVPEQCSGEEVQLSLDSWELDDVVEDTDDY